MQKVELVSCNDLLYKSDLEIPICQEFLRHGYWKKSKYSGLCTDSGFPDFTKVNKLFQCSCGASKKAENLKNSISQDPFLTNDQKVLFVESINRSIHLYSRIPYGLILIIAIVWLLSSIIAGLLGGYYLDTALLMVPTLVLSIIFFSISGVSYILVQKVKKDYYQQETQFISQNIV